MKTNHNQICFAALLWLFAASAQSADINTGKNISAGCQGCHGANGVSANSMWPNLAGQTALYIETQLKKFKDGSRESAVMKAMAQELSQEDIPNLAAYFASLPAASSGGDAALAKTGKDKVAMCMGCHGEKFQGQGQFPRLAGQHSEYLAKQLGDYKSGSRKAPHMNAVAKSLSDDDIKAITAYLGSLKN